VIKARLILPRLAESRRGAIGPRKPQESLNRVQFEHHGLPCWGQRMYLPYRAPIHSGRITTPKLNAVSIPKTQIIMDPPKDHEKHNVGRDLETVQHCTGLLVKSPFILPASARWATMIGNAGSS
jgi:hypothetical protein